MTSEARHRAATFMSGENVTQTTIIGLVAAFCSSMAFLPQVIHTIRTRSTHDISLKMYTLYSFGIFLWLVYGILLRDVPIILSNAVTLTLSLTILSLKLRHG